MSAQSQLAISFKENFIELIININQWEIVERFDNSMKIIAA
jgi:hypothetical protein